MGRGNNTGVITASARTSKAALAADPSLLAKYAKARIKRFAPPAHFKEVKVEAATLGEYLNDEDRQFFYNTTDIDPKVENAAAVKISVKANKADLQSARYGSTPGLMLEDQLYRYIQDKIKLPIFEGWEYHDPGDNPLSYITSYDSTQRSETVSIVATAEFVF